MLSFLAVCGVCCVGTAQAQHADWWVVVPASVQSTSADQASRAAEHLVPALQDRRLTVLSAHQASDRVASSSRPPSKLDQGDIDLLAEEAYQAVRHVAFGHRAAAARTVASVMKRAERAMETLNRDTKNARHVLDACLALVRSTMARGDRESALAEAMRCRRVVPDVTPSEMMHPPSVIGVLAEADDRLRRTEVGQLSVNSLPETGCSVYLNGRHLGTTPFRLKRAAAGKYRIQVECGDRPGRVHEVILGDAVVELTVDTVFDQALHTAGGVSLKYVGGRTLERRAVDDARKIAQLTRSAEVLLVTMQASDRVRLRRVRVDDSRVLAAATVAWVEGSYEEASLQAAIDALLQGRLLKPTAVAAVAAVPPGLSAAGDSAAPAAGPSQTAGSGGDAEPADMRKPRTPWKRQQKQARLGLPLLTAGIAGLVAGFVLYADARDKREQFEALPVPNPGETDLQQEAVAAGQAYDDARLKPLVAFGGGALGAAAMPFLLPDHRSVRWYAWVAGASGAAGVGVASLGFWQLALHDQCTVPTAQGCLRRRDTVPEMAVTFASAMPLLAVPLTYLTRMALGDRGATLQASLVPARDGLTFHLRGSL